LRASLEQQHTLLQLQAHDSAIDRLSNRRANLPEIAKLAELDTALAAIDQLTAERQGSLATVKREQARLEGETEMVTRKAASEEARAMSGRVTSPKELTSIQEEVAALKRRQSTLEDELLERMELRETLERELEELAGRRAAVAAEQVEVAQARDAALVEIDRELEVERAGRKAVEARVEEGVRSLYDQLRKRHDGVGVARLAGNTCQGCRVALSTVELANLRKLPAEEIKRCENCRRILVIE
jgi:predicted  nucleic acid-binding Zn-ribbon protein